MHTFIRAIKVQQMLNLVSQNVCRKTFAYLFDTSCTFDSTIFPNTFVPHFFVCVLIPATSAHYRNKIPWTNEL
jgi:hypothetical protein